MNPWMSEEEIQKIQSYLRSTDIFLEWGSGGSTIYFSQFVKEYISIEYDINWYKNIKETIINTKKQNINYIYCPPNNDILLPVWHRTSDPKNFIEYVNVIDNIPITKYDKVLIDGRSRVECAKKILSYTNKDSVIFIHDFFTRPAYFSVLDHYTLIDSIKEGQSLAVLKKKS